MTYGVPKFVLILRRCWVMFPSTVIPEPSSRRVATGCNCNWSTAHELFDEKSHSRLSVLALALNLRQVVWHYL
ncbi:hypothetical protein L6452_23885 [Arctium lappa]|uniref:Uncharacterized protein n=1 Tax=Arctium lappa TaxID=4217 RepID=A0ACB9A8Y7_ARCLA|nr:hypothetical protein L6452_23885 [Arctium lappa]